MLRSLLAGISGLRNHQLRLDVIGDNIANVNTVGYKASRVTLRDGFAQLLAQASQGGGGGSASQIGSGVTLGSIDSIFSQGSLEATGLPLDLAIQGNGLFVVSDGQQNYFTRAGNFQLDSTGRLVLAGTQLGVQGVTADEAGELTGSVGDLILNPGELSAPQATTALLLSGNLDASAGAGETRTVNASAYDPAGRLCSIAITFVSGGGGTWSWSASTSEGEIVPTSSGTLVFGSDGTLTNFTYPESATALTFTSPGGQQFSVELLPRDQDGNNLLTGYAGLSTAAASAMDGSAAGELSDLQVDATGTIYGIFSNGTDRVLGRLALATFANPSGLVRQGGSLCTASASSGEAVLGFAGEGNGTSLVAGALESSNVDLAQEFTDLIVTQRGFQANAKVITASNEVLAELINLAR